MTLACPKCDVNCGHYVCVDCPTCGENRVAWYLARSERGWFGDSDCPDCLFAHFGDMYSPNELREADLRDPRLREVRDGILADCVAAGIDDDQDPSSLQLSIPVMEGDTVDAWTERAVAAAVSAFRIRWGTASVERPRPPR